MGSRGVQVWICTSSLEAGSNFRDEIVHAIKACRVVVPLINNDWASSGECYDEFSLAKRRNLTSHESGRTVHPQARLPAIVPLAFPSLDWERFPHVELLAATTNFLRSETEVLADDSPVIQLVCMPSSLPTPQPCALPSSGCPACADRPPCVLPFLTPSRCPSRQLLQALLAHHVQDDGVASGEAPAVSKDDSVQDLRGYDPNAAKLSQRYLGTTAYSHDYSNVFEGRQVKVPALRRRVAWKEPVGQR